MPLETGIQTQNTSPQSEALFRARLEHAKNYCLMLAPQDELTGRHLALITGGRHSDGVLICAVAELTGRSEAEVQAELEQEKVRVKAEKDERQHSSKPQSKQHNSTPSEAQQVDAVSMQLADSAQERESHARELKRADRYSESQSWRKGNPFPRAFVRATASSDHDRRHLPVDRVDPYGPIKMSSSLGLIEKRLIIELARLQDQTSEDDSLWVSYGELERFVRPTQKNAVERGVSGGEAVDSLKAGLLALERIELDLQVKGSKASDYSYKGGVIESVVVDLGKDHGEIALARLDAYAQEQMAEGKRDPRRCIGARRSIQITLCSEFKATLEEDRKPVKLDQHTTSRFFSAVDLNTYLYLLSQTPKYRFDGETLAKGFYFPTADSSPEAKESRRLFRMLGIEDANVARAGNVLEESVRRIAPFIPSWGAVKRARQNNNDHDRIAIQQLRVRDHRCPRDLRYRKVTSRQQLRVGRCELRRERAEQKHEAQRARIALVNEVASTPSDGTQGALRAKQSAREHKAALVA